MEDILKDCPVSVTEEEINTCLEEVLSPVAEGHTVDEGSNPDNWNHPVGGACEHLEDWVVVDLDVSDGVDQMLGLVDEGNVIIPLESSLD